MCIKYPKASQEASNKKEREWWHMTDWKKKKLLGFGFVLEHKINSNDRNILFLLNLSLLLTSSIINILVSRKMFSFFLPDFPNTDLRISLNARKTTVFCKAYRPSNNPYLRINTELKSVSNYSALWCKKATTQSCNYLIKNWENPKFSRKIFNRRNTVVQNIWNHQLFLRIFIVYI